MMQPVKNEAKLEHGGGTPTTPAIKRRRRNPETTPSPWGASVKMEGLEETKSEEETREQQQFEHHEAMLREAAIAKAASQLCLSLKA